MHQIIYMSRATHPMSDDELETLLRKASLNNEQRGITGALVYGDGQFMQIMEGEKDALDTLYATVFRDPRHTDLTKLTDKEISDRSFSSWSMAFQALSPQQFQDLVGYTPPAKLTEQAHNLSWADDLLFQMMNAFGLSQRVKLG